MDLSPVSPVTTVGHDGAAPRPRVALVVRGGWEGHDPVAQTDELLPFLEEQGFETVVSDTLEVYADDALMARVDLVLQCWTMGEILPEELRGLRLAVERGAGLAGWHGGVVDSFRLSTDYQQMLGGQFVAHEHDLLRHTVTVTDPEHPITRGLPDYELDSEQYWMLTDAHCHVLAETVIEPREGDPWATGVRAPAAWTRQWGAGRIFVTTSGHTVEDLRHPVVRTMIERGLLWAAR